MRVIAGSARGQRLQAPTGLAVRPTSDRVKEAIFSVLEALAYRRGFQPQENENGDVEFAAALAWPRVLDLYSGSGALGIEALSRGAQAACFVEPDASARHALERNLSATRLEKRASVVPARLERALSELRGTFDLILADPPYDDASAVDSLRAVAESRLVTPGSVLVWEHRRNVEAPGRLGAHRLARHRRHGTTVVSVYTRCGDEPATS